MKIILINAIKSLVNCILIFYFLIKQLGGMKEGDFIVNIDDKDVKWASHEQVVRLIKQCGDSISLKLVTPMDRNYLKVIIVLLFILTIYFYQGRNLTEN